MSIDIDTIKRANPLQSVVERMTGQQIIKHKIRAPWRHEDTPSVHIYDDGSWWDYGAGIGGDVIDFVGYCIHGTTYAPSVHFTEVVDMLGGLDIKPLPAQTTRPAPPKPKLTLSMAAVQEWHDTMPANRRWYWTQRGLSDATIDRFLLGWDGKRYTIPAIYRGIPFGVKRRQSDIDDGIPAKYISLTGSRVGIFNADALWTAHDVVVCEGEIDAMLLCQVGYNAVSSTGGAGTWKPEWAKFFAAVRSIVILYDNDEPGRDGALKVRSTLARARIATYPDGIKDAGELFATHAAPVNWLYNNVG